MERPPEDSKPDMLVPGYRESLERRYGRVFSNAYIADRKHLFLHHLYEPIVGRGSGVSSFAVRASVFFAFFDKQTPTTNTSVTPIDDLMQQATGQMTQIEQERLKVILPQKGTQMQGAQHTQAPAPVQPMSRTTPESGEANTMLNITTAATAYELPGELPTTSADGANEVQMIVSSKKPLRQ